MTIHEYRQNFGGLPVIDLRPAASDEPSGEPGEQPLERTYGEPPPGYGIAPHEYPADKVAWRLRHRHWADDVPVTELYAYFLDNVDTTRVTALLVGAWDVDLSMDNPLVDLLIRDADRFPALRHLFLGDVVQEESEVSWISLSRMTGLLEAFPELEELVARGSEENGPALEPVAHQRLRSLTVESGGLSGRFVRSVGMSDLPALESLELWLGVEHYGGNTTLDDLADLLTGARLPALRHLGLMNSPLQDEIAAAVAGAAVTGRLTSLDLSMGTLGDVGVEALLSGQPLSHLEKLTIRHHFVGQNVTDRLRQAFTGSGRTLHMSAPEGQPAWSDGRYVAVAE